MSSKWLIEGFMMDKVYTLEVTMLRAYNTEIDELLDDLKACAINMQVRVALGSIAGGEEIIIDAAFRGDVPEEFIERIHKTFERQEMTRFDLRVCESSGRTYRYIPEGER